MRQVMTVGVVLGALVMAGQAVTGCGARRPADGPHVAQAQEECDEDEEECDEDGDKPKKKKKKSKKHFDDCDEDEDCEDEDEDEDEDGECDDDEEDCDEPWGIVDRAGDYEEVVERVVGMVNDSEIRQGAQRRGLDVVNVMWEDTGRSQGSSLGPNISDLTLQVRYKRPGRRGEQTALMPVIRFPNFTDRTGDIPADRFFVRVGNHEDVDDLESVPLLDVLRNTKRYLSKPKSIKGKGRLSAKRDTHFLVSAQAVLLPIPKKGKAEFNPVVFNYQSAPGSPAVLTMLVTRQGTSITVVENRAEDTNVEGWGQELYFNHEGKRAAFTAERKSDVKKRLAKQGGAKTKDDESALQRGADVLFLIQVPLKHSSRGYLPGLPQMSAGAPMAPPSPMDDAEAAAEPAARSRSSDTEQAVLGHGKKRGPFTEGNNLRLERDDRFPIRITVQFYKATSTGVLSERDLDQISKTIGDVYEHADFVGSLVMPGDDPQRPTAWQRVPSRWFSW